MKCSGIVKAYIGPFGRFDSDLWERVRTGDLANELGTLRYALFRFDEVDPETMLQVFAQFRLPMRRCLIDFGRVGLPEQPAIAAICRSLQPLGLRFRGLQMDESWPNKLNVSSLDSLELIRCNLPILVLRHILESSELQVLSLDRCNVDGEYAGSLFLHARHLRELSIQGTNLQSASHISDLRELPRLNELCIGGRELTAESLGSLSLLETLETLRINECNLDGDGLTSLQVPPCLQDLSIDARNLSDRHVLSWPPLLKLRRCALSDTLVGGASLRKLSASALICSLDVGGTEVRGDDLALLPHQMPGLSSLRLDNLSGLSQPLSFVPHLARLADLSVAAASLTDELISPLLGHPLVALTLDHNLVTEQGFNTWPAKSSLKELFLVGTAVRGEWLADSMALTTLDLSETATDDTALIGLDPKNFSWLSLASTAVGDKAAVRLSRFPVLRQLDLSETQIGDASLAALGDSNSIEHLRVLGCEVSLSAVSDFERRRPNCELDF